MSNFEKKKRIKFKNTVDFRGELGIFAGKGEIVYNNSIFGHRTLSKIRDKECITFKTEAWKSCINTITMTYSSKRMVLNSRDTIHQVKIMYNLTMEGMLKIYTDIDKFRKTSNFIQMLEKEDISYRMVLDSKIQKEPNIINIELTFDVKVSPRVMKIKRVYKISDNTNKEFVYWLDKKSRIIKTEIKIIEVIPEEERYASSVEKIEELMDDISREHELIESRRYDHNS